MQQCEYLQDIEQYGDWRLVEPVNKGWSSDKKYYVETHDGKRLLLRLAACAQYAAKEQEFRTMGIFSGLGITMSQPLAFGVCGNGRYVYSLLSWLDGGAADEVLLSRSESEQFQLGQQAGRMLQRMHTVAAPPEQPDWEQRMLKKFRAHREKYRACGIKVPQDQLALRYLDDNLLLLRDRPQVLQHGDFHVGNMIVDRNGGLGIIDFNRWDYGDPYEDFYKMMLFSRELSIPFARGQMAGYFGDDVPEGFYRLLALYVADVILYSVVWAIPFGREEVAGMIRRAEMMLDDYAGFTTCKPAWMTIG